MSHMSTVSIKLSENNSFIAFNYFASEYSNEIMKSVSKQWFRIHMCNHITEIQISYIIYVPIWYRAEIKQLQWWAQLQQQVLSPLNINHARQVHFLSYNKKWISGKHPWYYHFYHRIYDFWILQKKTKMLRNRWCAMCIERVYVSVHLPWKLLLYTLQYLLIPRLSFIGSNVYMTCSSA